MMLLQFAVNKNGKHVFIPLLLMKFWLTLIGVSSSQWWQLYVAVVIVLMILNQVGARRRNFWHYFFIDTHIIFIPIWCKNEIEELCRFWCYKMKIKSKSANLCLKKMAELQRTETMETLYRNCHHCSYPSVSKWKNTSILIQLIFC